MATSSTQSEFLTPSIWSSLAAQDALLPIRLAKGGFDGGLDESDSVSDSGKGVCKAALIELCREAGGGIRAESIALPWSAISEPGIFLSLVSFNSSLNVSILLESDSLEPVVVKVKPWDRELAGLTYFFRNL